MISTTVSVATGVVLGGIVLSWLRARSQEKINRLMRYWETYYSTPLHMGIFISAKDSLIDQYGEKYIDKVIEWGKTQKLITSPEKRLGKLDLLCEGEVLKDKEIRMYSDVLRHWAVRQWASDCGLNDAFERWERECVEKLNAASSS